MKAKYIGDPSQPREGVPEEFQAYGVTFPKDKFVDVPDAQAAKFAGNSHFVVQGKPGTPEAREAVAETETTVSPEAAAEADELAKAQLRGELEELGAKQPGARANVATLREAVEAARADAAAAKANA